MDGEQERGGDEGRRSQDEHEGHHMDYHTDYNPVAADHKAQEHPSLVVEEDLKETRQICC